MRSAHYTNPRIYGSRTPLLYDLTITRLPLDLMGYDYDYSGIATL